MKRRAFSLLFALLMLFTAGCTPTEDNTDPAPTSGTQTDVQNTDSVSDTETDEKEEYPLNKVKDLVIACDQRNTRLVIYDLSDMNEGDPLDDVEEWSVDLKGHGGATNLSGVKYREDTVFGDVIIAVASGGFAGIIKYPSKEVIWETKSCGSNPHSIEILPNGNLVCASSNGNTLRIYHTSALLKGDKATADTYLQYNLYGAHGVLWDPTEEVLWALGDKELRAYGLVGEASEQKLTVLGGMGLPLPATHPGGHDLSADFSDKNYLYVTTNKGVLRFNKEENAFATDYPFASVISTVCTGFGNNLNGNFAISSRNGGKGTPWENASYASWCTDTIQFARRTGEATMVKETYKAADSAFYKVRIFYGQYQ